jgi:hypothetical protein
MREKLQSLSGLPARSNVFSHMTEAATENFTLLETVRRERAAARLRDEERTGSKVRYGYSSGRCQPLSITTEQGSISFGILCGGRAPRKRCQVCKQKWSQAQCDYPLPNPCKKCSGKGQLESESDQFNSTDYYNCEHCAGTGRAMCNRHLCADCRGHLEPDEDYCPEHRVSAGLPPLIRREPCAWTMQPPRIINRKCLRESCAVVINADDHVLFFPRRSRAMCKQCGREYERVAQ